MEIELITANSIYGVNQFWRVVDAENKFFIGREICYQNTGYEIFVGWRGSKKIDIQNSWDSFKAKNNIKNIEISKQKTPPERPKGENQP